MKKLVKAIGNGAHVTLPKQWVGQFVKVELEEEQKGEEDGNRSMR